ncbi:MAG: hypothetical protein BWY83_00727 [bacterium ADurb.Bin478]|nr:hypothetical protein [bacterium]OPZ72290.1 MAG: hypothetical protein BWY83_00727 [bacterium ADurb.Bin478]
MCKLLLPKSNVLVLFGVLSLCLKSAAQELPRQKSNLFSGSGNCAVCHRAGNGAFTTSLGTDISPTELWRSTMMANSFKDPLWQAKVSAEVTAHSALQSIIEDKCTTCHAPMGRTEAIFNGSTSYSFSQAVSDPLSGDGVSCTLCHQIQKDHFGEESGFSGHYVIRNDRIIFGPYAAPTGMPMFNQTGYSPVYSQHVQQSELCAVCHTLFTPYVDNQGQIAGYFPEQVPYLEWKNSVYATNGVSCQSCHMPPVSEPMKITTSPPTLTTLRSPVYAHDFVGANVLMNSIFSKFPKEIGIAASADNLATTKRKTKSLLNEATVALSVDGQIAADTLALIVRVENLTGHKFPTGFPSRQAWLHLLVKNQNNHILFESGNWNTFGEILRKQEGVERHHRVIRDPGQVQIYQAVMQDVDERVTYTLLRGARYVKDNRLPPKGFTAQVQGYETIAVVGEAAVDPDFNRNEAGEQGSGTDNVHYRIFIGQESGTLTVTAELRYQTISFDFMEDLFSYAADPVLRFKTYYEAVEHEPMLIRSSVRTFSTTSLDLHEEEKLNPLQYGLLQNYPNPFNGSTMIQFAVRKPALFALDVYDLRGRKIKTLAQGNAIPGVYQQHWDGTNSSSQTVPSGVYLACLQLDGEKWIARMIFLQ